jgi:hypothetical protein
MLATEDQDSAMAHNANDLDSPDEGEAYRSGLE